MFTGIIEETGQIRGIQRGPDSCLLHVGASRVLEGTRPGDSIAVNGVCLTVTELKADGFFAHVMHETLDRSSLKYIRPGQRVNLERAMALGGRFGGHIVSGHIDGTGTILKMRRDDIAVWLTIGAAPKLMRYIVEKGSVALDGISLTVADVKEGEFRVSVIPHTFQVTALSHKRPGALVNIENDVIGKYVEKLLEKPAQHSPDSDGGGQGLTAGKLAMYGFL